MQKLSFTSNPSQLFDQLNEFGISQLLKVRYYQPKHHTITICESLTSCHLAERFTWFFIWLEDVNF